MELFHKIIHFYVFVLLVVDVTSRFLDDAANTDVNAVRVRLAEEKSQRLLLKNDVEFLMLKMEETERKLNALSTERPTEISRSSNVYFNVKLTSTSTIGPQQVVLFDKVVENIGEGYSSSSGIFRATSPGIYLFSLTILSAAKAKNAHIQLMKNDAEIGRAFAGSDVASWGQTGTVTVTAHLMKEDEVYAREFPGLTGQLYGNEYCSFSGVLLQTDV